MTPSSPEARAALIAKARKAAQQIRVDHSGAAALWIEDLANELEQLGVRVERAAAPSPLAEFFRRAWETASEGRELDGSQIQEWGEQLGLLRGIEVTEPCGDGCNCDEMTGGDFPMTCYRPTDLAGAAPDTERGT